MSSDDSSFPWIVYASSMAKARIGSRCNWLALARANKQATKAMAVQFL